MQVINRFNLAAAIAVVLLANVGCSHQLRSELAVGVIIQSDHAVYHIFCASCDQERIPALKQVIIAAEGSLEKEAHRPPRFPTYDIYLQTRRITACGREVVRGCTKRNSIWVKVDPPMIGSADPMDQETQNVLIHELWHSWTGDQNELNANWFINRVPIL